MDNITNAATANLDKITSRADSLTSTLTNAGSDVSTDSLSSLGNSKDSLKSSNLKDTGKDPLTNMKDVALGSLNNV